MGDFNKNRSFGKRNAGKSNFRGKFKSAPRPFDKNTRTFAPRNTNSRLEMHSTVCAKCGNDCEVPFKPNNRKPVFCSQCFRKDGDYESRNDSFETRNNDKSELSQINEKLDKILRILERK